MRDFGSQILNDPTLITEDDFSAGRAAKAVTAVAKKEIKTARQINGLVKCFISLVFHMTQIYSILRQRPKLARGLVAHIYVYKITKPYLSTLYLTFAVLLI